jgi:hypothetical protein
MSKATTTTDHKLAFLHQDETEGSRKSRFDKSVERH